MHLSNQTDTIYAIATPPGIGALAIIRLSGKDAFSITNKIFETKSGKHKDFENVKPYTIHFGNILLNGKTLDEVLISVFKGPNSFTGENTIEISTHGSPFIQQELLKLLSGLGARSAEPGEFTLRAFLNGKLDLSQAEAVADLISSQHAVAHKTAINQLRGGYSSKMQQMRQQLIDFASLLELELDFAEEDVEFANRDQLTQLVNVLFQEVARLQSSFEVGNVMKQGIPIVIAGKPNTGKSTLLNTFLQDDKAIVSSIAGTTRDVVEDKMIINGYLYRFIDTAGLRKTDDEIEKIGVVKSYEQVDKASLVLYMIDPTQSDLSNTANEISDFLIKTQISKDHLFIVLNKSDLLSKDAIEEYQKHFENLICISAKQETNIDLLKSKIVDFTTTHFTNEDIIITNARHAEALNKAGIALDKLLNGLKLKHTSDILAFELKQALHYIGEITGTIYTDDLLANIFSKFCIGK